MKKLLIIATLLGLASISHSQYIIPTSPDTMGYYPYFHYSYWPDQDFHDSVDIRVIYGDPDSSTVFQFNCSCDEYAFEQYSNDTITILGIAIGPTDGNRFRITIYDSNMNAQGVLYGFFPSIAWIEGGRDTTARPMPIITYPHYSPDYFNYMEFLLFDQSKGNSSVTISGKYYIGLSSYFPGVGLVGAAKTRQMYELHNTNYFKKHEYRILVDGVWSSGDSSRAIPLVFPIINPQCHDDVGNYTVSHLGDSALTVTWDTAGLRGIPVGVTAPAVDFWLGPRGGTPDSATARCMLPPWRCDSLRSGSYDLYARKVCSPQYDVASDWRLIDTFYIAGPPSPPPASVNTPEAGSFTLTPNPTTGRVTVTLEAPAEAGVTMELYDSEGRRVATYAVAAGTTEQTLDLAALPAGVYHLRMLTQKGTASRRLVVGSW